MVGRRRTQREEEGGTPSPIRGHWTATYILLLFRSWNAKGPFRAEPSLSVSFPCPKLLWLTENRWGAGCCAGLSNPLVLLTTCQPCGGIHRAGDRRGKQNKPPCESYMQPPLLINAFHWIARFFLPCSIQLIRLDIKSLLVDEGRWAIRLLGRFPWDVCTATELYWIFQLANTT